MESVLKLKVPGIAEVWRMLCCFVVMAQDNVIFFSYSVPYIFQVQGEGQTGNGERRASVAKELLHALGLGN